MKCSSCSAIARLEAALIILVIILAIVAGVGYWQAATVAPATSTVTRVETRTTTQTVTTTIAPGAPATVTVTQPTTTTITQPTTVTQTTTRTVTQPTTVTQTITTTAAAPGLPSIIKIGVLCDLSGAIGPVGSHFYQGAHIAAKIVNDTGGIGGRPIKLIIEDTKSDPQAALDATRKLIEVDGVQVIVGPITSVATLTIAKYVNERRVPIIATIATSAKITELGDDYVFRVVASDVQAGGRASVALLKERGASRIVTFVVSDDYGVGVENYVKETLGDRIVASIRIDPKKGDFRSELTAVKAANPDAILWTIWIENAKIVFRQVGEIGLTVPFSTATNVVYNPVLFEDPRVAESVTAINLHVQNEKVAKGTYTYDRFASIFKETYKEEPWEPGAKHYYDATMLAIMAIAHAGVYDGAKIKKALTIVSQHYLGASGLLAFDEVGDRKVVPAQEYHKVIKTAEGKYEFKPVAVWDPITDKIMWY